MGKDSGIQWTDHTFNPWRGCTKVSPGCTNCYADTLSKRNPATLGVWGPKGTRVVASESMWRKPIEWNRESQGERQRVFCASLADVFEDWPGPMETSKGVQIWKRRDGSWTTSDHYRDTVALTMDDVRARLFGLVVPTRRLDWLILTKRPERMRDHFRSRSKMWSAAEAYRDLVYGADSGVGTGDGLCRWPPANLWAGTTVEDRQAKARIDVLREVDATVRFLSVEPLIEDIGTLDLAGIHWVIVGGESGSKVRPFDLAWARSIRDQCRAAGVAYFFKQAGSNPYDSAGPGRGYCAANMLELKDSHGGDLDELPADLRVREFPGAKEVARA